MIKNIKLIIGFILIGMLIACDFSSGSKKDVHLEQEPDEPHKENVVELTDYKLPPLI